MALQETSSRLPQASNAAGVHAELQLGRLRRRERRYSWGNDCALIIGGPPLELAMPVGLDEHAIEIFLETADESVDVGFHLGGITALCVSMLLLHHRRRGEEIGGSIFM